MSPFLSSIRARCEICELPLYIEFTARAFAPHSASLDSAQLQGGWLMHQYSYAIRVAIGALAFLLLAFPMLAQVTPAAGYTPPDDTPSVKVDGTIFADYTYVNSPKILDSDKNSVNASAFNLTRAYINVTGNIFHRASFRITPDITRETGTGSSLNGSLTFRLKYAGQYNLDDWTTKGSWLRLGIQQTPWIDYDAGIYRYRFQGTTFADREGYITSSDAAFSGHWNFPGNYGDVHGGFYNGEGYNRVEP